ncbi:E3 ubiquitin-protein ligase RNF220-like [Glandiceps talaboti]
MENSTFLPQHLGTPGLMVLASTAEASRDPMRPAFQGDQHPPGLDKDSFPGFHALFHRQNMTEFLSPRDFPPHFISLHPQLRHSFEATRFLSTAGGGAFRRFNSEERENVYSSAFMPMKRSKPNHISNRELSAHFLNSDISRAKDFSMSHVFDKEDLSHRERSPTDLKKEKDDRMSVSTLEMRSTPTECESTDRSSPEEVHTKMNIHLHVRLYDGQKPVCPICGMTLKPGEVTRHFAIELDQLNETGRASRKSLQEKKVLHIISQTDDTGIVAKKTSKDGNSDLPSMTRFENFQRVRSNRQQRLHAARARKKKRTSEEFGASTSSDANGMICGNTAADSDVIAESMCPICNQKITGTSEEINHHAEACIRKRQSPGHDDDHMEVFEEYEWAGQTRIRATTMLEGGFAGSGFQVHKRKDDGDSDVDLNVDGDESVVYGAAQYSERDVIPCTSEEPNEEKERRALRVAVLKAERPPPVNSPTVDRTRWESSESAKQVGDSEKTEEQQKTENSSNNSDDIDVVSTPEDLIASLKAKVKMLEKQSKPDKYKCLICMEMYHTPVVSVQCWHVHCEECWLRTLGAKKLCPQCNMITSPSDLRKIYL